MNYYSYSSVSREYTGSGEARLSPLEKNVYLLPANATFDASPEPGANEVAVRNGTAWEIKPDFRGSNVYNSKTGEQIIISEIGALPENAVCGDIPVKNGRFDTWSGVQWLPDTAKEIEYIIAQLWKAATNYVESQINAAEYAKTLSLTNNAKAAANLDWYNALWQDYYTRSAAVLQDGDLNPLMDFSNNGIKPYKFWEIMAE